MPWSEPPEADIDRYVRRLSRQFGISVSDVQALLLGLNIDGLSQAEQRALISEINEIYGDLEGYVINFVNTSIDEVYEHGRARALVALGIVASIAAAKRRLRQAPISHLHRTFMTAEKEVFVDDLLAATSNTKRRVKRIVRQVAAERLRQQRDGSLSSRTTSRRLERDVRQRLGDAADFAIRDALNRRWRLRVYAEMVARTKLTETHFESTRNEAIEHGAFYAVVSNHANPCEKCAPWQSRIVKLTSDASGNYPTLDEARSSGLFHPHCKHSISPVRSVDLLPESIRQIN